MEIINKVKKYSSPWVSELILIPATTSTASQSAKRLIKKPTNPNKSRLIGKLKSFKTGTIVQFKTVNTIKKAIEAKILSTSKLSKIFDKINKIIVLIVKNKAASIIEMN